MKIMVTGATGFIGNRLVQVLSEEDNIIHVLCRSTSDKSRLVHPTIKIFNGDILDKTSIEQAMNGCDMVYHLAAYARNWSKDSNIFFEYNANSLENIFDAALKLKIKRVLFTSSCVVFGPSNGSPVNENTNRNILPLTSYEASKLEAERMVTNYLNQGLHIVSIYPTRLFGPGLLTESNGVTKMIDLYLKGKMRLILGNGEAVGNYVFVDDVVNGMINALRLGIKGAKYILGGDNLSFNEFFKRVAEKSGEKYKMIHFPEKLVLMFGKLEEARAKISNHYPLITPGWIKTFCLDWKYSSDKAQREINYKITPFDETLDKTLSWLKLDEGRRTSCTQ